MDDTTAETTDPASDYEVSKVPSHAKPAGLSARTHPFPPGRLFSRRGRLALTIGTVLLVLLVIGRVWLPLVPWHALNQSHTFTSYPSPTPRATATPVLLPTPLPITRPLAAPPTDCPSAPPLMTMTVPAFDGFTDEAVHLNGGGPVWIPSPYLPQPITEIPQPTPPSAAQPTWPSLFIIWELGPAHPTVTGQVHDLHSNTLVWWAEGGSKPQMPILVMNPTTDEPTAVGYVAYQTLLFITEASCYAMSVTWPGGSWTYLFAAGLGPI